MNKKGMELSVSTIVILIIAIVTLGVILGFITGFLPKLFGVVENWPVPTTQPTPENEIVFLPLTMDRGKDNKMTIEFYNNEQADIANTVIPTITCPEIASIAVKGSGMAVPVGEIKEYKILVSIPKNTPAGSYSCTLKISSTEENFFLEVK